ncbi:hypothetical protein [Deinococcus multiflagellatus]|uniref:Uncharacterized protein n=1 Tax=Deinococcus multiflagellatus TaxID=1656887 RepID=A0ABW1ZFN7_9DEIO
MTDTEHVPAAAPATYRAAQEILTAAGAWDIWAAWTKARKLDRAAQDAQIIQFATWVQEGRASELRQHAGEITVAGSYAHPYLALADRMRRAAKVQQAETANRANVRKGAQCQPGERRRAPNGQVWTIESVEHGLVYFAESNAPWTWVTSSWPAGHWKGCGMNDLTPALPRMTPLPKLPCWAACCWTMMP